MSMKHTCVVSLFVFFLGTVCTALPVDVPCELNCDISVQQY